MRAYEQTFEKTVGAGPKLDLVLTLVRVAFFFGDDKLLEKNLKRCKEYVNSVFVQFRRSSWHLSRLIDKGGDWDRRTRLKVYESRHLISKRQFEEAADLVILIL